MIDGVHFGEHLCVVALGIDIDGTKHPLGLAEGSTENTTVVTDLLTALRERGLDTNQPIFVGIDGGKALRTAVVQVFEHPVIQRCQLHKIRNVADKLPDRLAATAVLRQESGTLSGLDWLTVDLHGQASSSARCTLAGVRSPRDWCGRIVL